MRKSLLALWAAVAAGLLACANAYGPPGGEPDREPPQVVATSPEPMAVVPGWSDAVVIRFDERVSEQRIREAVTVSPETGEVRVEKGRSEVRVSLEGGWKPGQIYRIVVHPVVADLFRNVRKEEFELIFSTGPQIPSTALGGMVTDRLTGRPVAGARVEAVRQADSVKYVALSDSAGFFGLRHVPAGAYDLLAYLDRSRNRKPDFGEPRAAGAAALAASDTTLLTFDLLAEDTTPARVVRAEAKDSLQVRVVVDDALDPAEPLGGLEAKLFLLPDSVALEVAEVLHAHAFEARAAAARAAAADTAAAADSSAAVVADSSAAARPARPDPVKGAAESGGAQAGAAASGAAASGAAPLPSREFVVVPRLPLSPKARLLVVIQGIRNLAGVEGGGGSAVFEAPAQPAPAAPADTTTGGAAPDSSRTR